MFSLFVLSFIIAISVRNNNNDSKMKYCSKFKIIKAVIVCLLISGFNANLLDLYEGDICRKGKAGSVDYVCRQPENCPSLEQDIRRQNFPQICSFIKNIPVVCCSPTVKINSTNYKPPPISTTANRSSSYSATEMCREYSKLVYANPQPSPFHATGSPSKTLDCFNVMTLIVGGTKARPKEFPHMALLGYLTVGEKEQKTWGCGGSLISDRWIMSAAHCAKNSGRNVSWARLGYLNIHSDPEDHSPVEYDIVERVVHPNYNSTYVYNDIALFRLGEEVKFSAYVRPACLNTIQSFHFDTATATGWGRTSTNGPISPNLLKVDLSPISIERCKYSYPPSSNPRINLGIIDDNMICAADVNDGDDTCTGDSGGPLQVKHASYICMQNIIGITSFGKYCGNRTTPGVYTRVSNYISWIERIVWPKF